MKYLTKILILIAGAISLSACVADGVYTTDYYSTTTTYVPAYPRYHYYHRYYNYPVPAPTYYYPPDYYYGYRVAPAQTNTYVTPGYRGWGHSRNRPSQSSYYTPAGASPQPMPPSPPGPSGGGYSINPAASKVTPAPAMRPVSPAARQLTPVPAGNNSGYVVRPGN